MKEKKNVGMKKTVKREIQARPPKAIIFWLVIGLVMAAFMLFNNFGKNRMSEIELGQSEFIAWLKAGRIESAQLINDSNQIYDVKGTLRHQVKVVSSAVTDAIFGDNLPPIPAGVTKFKTRVVYTDALDALLKGTKVQISGGNSFFWHVFWVGIVPTVLFILFFYLISARQMKMGRGLDFGRSRAKMIPPDELNVKFDDIAGADEAKTEVMEIVDYLKDPLRFQLVGGKIPKGCLLVGNPGTGKTMMAKAVACEAGVPFFSISGSDFVEMFVGVGASRVRDMFEQARKNMPCLIFIDEIDAVGRSRFSGWGGGHDEREQTLNAMLVEMDGLESRNGVIVLAATNRPDVLDPALLRPGRFDRQVVMDLPDIKGRLQILNVHVKKIKVDPGIDLNVIAKTTPGFSGADLANLCNEAALLAARRNHTAVSQGDLEEARDKVSYGAERRSRRITEHERKLTAFHEAGHTLVALYNEYCTPVHKVSIIPRGNAYLGATFTMPDEDTYTTSRLELEAQMAMCMGGRAAEELVFNDITTGASGDIEQLTSLARRMVCIWGMSEDIGPVKTGDYTNHPHLRIDGPPPENLAPETEREIDLAVRKLVMTALERARECLKTHRDELDKLAGALLEQESMDIDAIGRIIDLPARYVKKETVSMEMDSVAADVESELKNVDVADNADGVSSETIDCQSDDSAKD